MDRAELRARLSAPYRIGRKLGGWDQVQIAEDNADYLMEEYPDEYPDREEAIHESFQDAGLYDLEWDTLLEWVSELLKERMPKETWPTVPWYVEARGFGWRKLNGYAIVDTLDGQEFLGKILPDTDCTFYFYEYGEDGLAINNFHHDSPTGEWYYITPLWGSVCCHCGKEYTADDEEDEREFILTWDECPDCMAENLSWDLHREGNIYTPYLYALGKDLDAYNGDPDHGYLGHGWLDSFLSDMEQEQFAPEIVPFSPMGEIDCHIEGLQEGETA